MYRTHFAVGAIRRLATVIIIIALIPSGQLSALQAAAPQRHPSHEWSDETLGDQAKRIVIHAGVGRHIEVRLDSGERIAGEIREIADDHFVLMLDRTRASVDIPYDDVLQLGPVILQPARRSHGPSGAAMMAVVVGVLLVAFSYNMHRCSQRRPC